MVAAALCAKKCQVNHPPKSGKSMRFGEGLRRPRREQSPFRNEENVATSVGSCMCRRLRLVAAVSQTVFGGEILESETMSFSKCEVFLSGRP